MTRREAREQAFILVFEQTVREEPMDSILHDAVEARDLIPSSFAEREALGVEEHREEVDQAIGEAHPGVELAPAVKGDAGAAASGCLRNAVGGEHSC